MDAYIDDTLTDDSHAPPGAEQSGIVMSGSDLAKILGVGSSSLSQSARSGWQCRGYAVSDWARWDEHDERIVNYDVPTAVVDRLTGPDAPDFPEPAPNPPADTVRRAPVPVPDSVASAPEQPWMQAPWGMPPAPYGAGFAPNGWPPAAIPASVQAPPAVPLGVEQVVAPLQRVIEELHRQAERRTEEHEKSRQALREDNDRLRDELRRAQDHHAKEIRDTERQLAKVRDDASEKRIELRERLMDAQLDARLAEGGIEESWFSRLVDRHGEDLASVIGGVATAFANRTVMAPDATVEALPAYAHVQDPLSPDPFTDPIRVTHPVAPSAPAPVDTLQAEAQSEMVERIALLLAEESPEAIEEVFVALQSQMSGTDSAALAAAVIGQLIETDPAAIGTRLRAVVASQFPMALKMPPATVVQMARGYSVAVDQAEADWLLELVRAAQKPERTKRPTSTSETDTSTSTPNPS